MRNYIDVDVNDLPDIFDINIVDEEYVIRVDYNSFADYYTITIQKDGETLLEQEPLILGQLVGIDIPDPRLPRVDIRVMDETNQARDAGKGKKKTSKSSKTKSGKRTKKYTALTLKPGDTLWALSKKYGKSVKWLTKVNKIKDPNKISAGKKIRVR